MEIIATTKYVRVSPRKLQLVADSVRKLTPAQAMVALLHMRKSSALPLRKTIHSAISNAKNRNIGNESDLIFSRIEVLPASAMKRFRAVSRGMAHEYKKRMSHIRVILNQTMPTTQMVKKTEVKTVEKSPKVAAKGKHGTKS